MIIKSLELENIRSYKSQIIDFEGGINFLSGDIGSGKSSILLAIEFALLGFKRGDLEGHHLLRKGEKEASVKLVLGDHKTDIEIFRKIKKSKSSDTISQENGYLKINSDIIELSPQELNSHIFELLSFPKEFITKDKNLVYRFTIYTPQEQLKEILFSENEKRLEVIRKIFRIDKYKQLLDAIAIYSSKLKSDFKVFEAKLEPFSQIKEDNKDIDKEIKTLDDSLENLLEKEKPFREKISKCKEGIEKREIILEGANEKILLVEKKLTQIDEIENLNKKYAQEILQLKKNIDENPLDKIDREIKDKNELIKTYEKSIDELKKKIKDSDIESIVEDLNKQKEEINKKLYDFENQKKEFNKLSSSFDNILTRCQIKDLENEITKLSSAQVKYDKLNEDNEKLKIEIIKLESEITSLRKSLHEKKLRQTDFSKIESCPTCLQEVDCSHKEKIEKSFDEDINKDKKAVDILEQELEKKRIEAESISNKLKDLGDNKNAILEKKEKLKFLKEKDEKEKDLLKQVKDLEEDLKKSSKVDFYKSMKDLDEKFNQIKKDKEILDMQKEKIDNINIEISETKLIINNLENQKKDLLNSSKKIEELEKSIEENKKKIDKKDEFKTKIEEFRRKVEKVKEERNKLKEHLENLFEKEKLLNSKIISIKTQIDSKKKDKERLQKEIEKLSDIEIQYKNSLNTDTFLNRKVTKISSLIERAVFTKYYAQFNEEFERLFKSLIEDNEIDVRLDEEFAIKVEQNGFDIDIKNLSGGEKSSLAIAYRLGLKKIIEDSLKGEQRLNLLILDEPTDGFSNEQIDRLGNILKESNLNQIILVSHDEKIESIADRVLHVEKGNHISNVM